MQYLNKLLNAIKKDPSLFKSSDIIIKTGLTLNQIKSLKKYALDNLLIKQSKGWYFLTPKGEEYLSRKPLQSWINKDFPLRPNINLEILKEEKQKPTNAIKNGDNFNDFVFSFRIKTREKPILAQAKPLIAWRISSKSSYLP